MIFHKTHLIRTALSLLCVFAISVNGQLALAASGDAIPADKNTIGVTDTEVAIGSCAPLSGQMKVRGAQVVSGGRAYFSYINDQGGVNGRKINLVSCDDEYKAASAIICFDNCLKGKVLAGALFQGTAAATKIVPMSELNHLPVVGFSMGAQFLLEPVRRTVFQVRSALDNETTEQVNTLWKTLGIRKIAIVFQNDAYGAACREGVVKALQKLGAVPVAQVSYSRLSENVNDVIKELHDSHPQALVLAASGDALPMIVKRKQEIGADVLLVGISVGTDILVKEAGDAANGVIITQVVPLTQTDLPTVKLYEKLLSKYEHAQPSFSSFEGFLIAMTVVEGLKRAGKDLTREKFVQALESLHDVDMGLGSKFKLSFSPTNHDGFSSGVYWTVIKNGKVENVTDWASFKRH